MKKWIGPLISLFLIFILGIGLVSGSFSILTKTIPNETKTEGYRIILTQNEKEEKKGETDPHLILILKEVQKKLEEWLKSLNERIDSEDITRFEVRFLEILRNILEWIKEKVEAKIESSEKEKPIKKEKKGLFLEARQEILPFSEIG
jgi:uncharacterized protein YceK